MSLIGIAYINRLPAYDPPIILYGIKWTRPFCTIPRQLQACEHFNVSTISGLSPFWNNYDDFLESEEEATKLSNRLKSRERR